MVIMSITAENEHDNFLGHLTALRAPLGCVPDVSEKRAASILQADSFGHTFDCLHNRTQHM